jgi:glycine cleavage system aminomethyltransferase T
MSVRGGWNVPEAYGSVEAEVEAARTRVAFGEQVGASHLLLEGGGLSAFMSEQGAGDLVPGRAALLSAPGGSSPYEGLRLCRLTRDSARLLPGSLARDDSNPSGGPGRSPWGTGKRSRRREGKGAGDPLYTTDLSSAVTTLLIAGPRSPDLLAGLLRLDVDPAWFRDRQVALTAAAGVPLLVLRWDRGAILAYDLVVGRDVAEYFCEPLARAAQWMTLALLGAEAIARLAE